MGNNIVYFFSSTLDQTFTLSFNAQHPNLVRFEPEKVIIRPDPSEYLVSLVALSPGSLLVTGELAPKNVIRCVVK